MPKIHFLLNRKTPQIFKYENIFIVNNVCYSKQCLNNNIYNNGYFTNTHILHFEIPMCAIHQRFDNFSLSWQSHLYTKCK